MFSDETLWALEDISGTLIKLRQGLYEIDEDGRTHSILRETTRLADAAERIASALERIMPPQAGR